MTAPGRPLYARPLTGHEDLRRLNARAKEVVTGLPPDVKAEVDQDAENERWLAAATPEVRRIFSEKLDARVAKRLKKGASPSHAAAVRANARRQLLAEERRAGFIKPRVVDNRPDPRGGRDE